MKRYHFVYHYCCWYLFLLFPTVYFRIFYLGKRTFIIYQTFLDYFMPQSILENISKFYASSSAKTVFFIIENSNSFKRHEII